MPLPEFALVDGLEGCGPQLGPQHPFRVDEVLPHGAGNDPAVLRAAEDVHDVADDVRHDLDVVDSQVRERRSPKALDMSVAPIRTHSTRSRNSFDQGQVVRQHPDA